MEQADYCEIVNDLYDSLSDEEKIDIRKAKNRTETMMFIESEEYDIEINKDLIEKCKDIIKKRVSKENYTEADEETVKLALEIISNCEKEIKKSEKEIYLLTKYPIGSRRRPGIMLK